MVAIRSAVENTDVNIHVLGSSILFRINYRPEVEYFLVKNLKNQPVAQYNVNAQIETYTGFTQLQGSLVFKVDDESTTEYVRINETLPRDIDNRFKFLSGLAVDNVSEEQYDPAIKIQYPTRLIDQEKKLFDEAMIIFRDQSLERLIRQTEFIQKITSSDNIEWKTW